MLNKKTELKEAFKVSISLVIVYGIALKLAWFSPSWAAWAVVMISSAATTGLSIQKGLRRIGGTLIAGVFALTILAIAPQQRWLFIFLVGLWFYATTYKMLVDPKRAYFWYQLSHVALIVAVIGPTSSDNIFTGATFRLMDALLGVTVYSLVSVLIWPINSMGAITKNSIGLLTAQLKTLNLNYYANTNNYDISKITELYKEELKYIKQLDTAVDAEATENFEVKQVMSLWSEFRELTTSLTKVSHNWQSNYSVFGNVDIDAVMPAYKDFQNELTKRYSEFQGLLQKQKPTLEIQKILLKINTKSFNELSLTDKETITIIKKELERIDVLTNSIHQCLLNIYSYSESRTKTKPEPENIKTKRSVIPVFDKEILLASLYPTLTLLAGFALWIYLNVPGGASIVVIMGCVAPKFLQMPNQYRLVMTKSILGIAIVAIITYVIIMPLLSSFVGLGLFLFISMFIVSYFLTGMTRFAAQVAILAEFVITNPQSFNFAGTLTGYAAITIAFVVMLSLLYIINGARPEKSIIKFSERFFHSAQYNISNLIEKPIGELSEIEKYRADYSMYEIHSLPTKMSALAASVNTKYFPSDSASNVGLLSASLQSIVYRFDELSQINITPKDKDILLRISEDIIDWQSTIEGIFANWSVNPDTVLNEEMTNQLMKKLEIISSKFDIFIKMNKDELDSDLNDNEGFYRLMGNLRGLTLATISYSGTTKNISWPQWKEEYFL